MRDSKRLFPIALLSLTACASLALGACSGSAGGGSALPAVSNGVDSAGSLPDQPITVDNHGKHNGSPAPSATPSSSPAPSTAPSSSPAPTAAPTTAPTSAPTVTPAPTATPVSSSTMWHIGNSYVLPSTSDGQYQKPTINGTSADFSLIRNYNGTDNYRNQMNPTINGSLVRLSPGTTYDWKFQTVANMAPDVNYSQNLIWQIHDYNAGTSPITVLGTQNINDGHTVWYFHGGSGTWKGTYTQGATDTWEIQVKVASDGSGTEKLWRNGALVSSQTGANYSTSSQGNPWWNFGPYEWDWKSTHSSGQISNLTSLDFVFNYMNFGVAGP